ncbi:SDR family NAD(P)-dependent oxidoreductase [Jatrophihabitans endophyticus]|nr:SDR family oxidoreductase [Jatrophihabitans endophyticus]
MTSRVRSALVTGGGSGIGLATASALHRAGYALTLIGRRAEVLAAAQRAVTAQADGPPVTTHVADVGDADAALGCVAEHVGRTGGIDALVAAAGAYAPAPLAGLTAAQWDATLDVHVRAAVLMAAAAGRQMGAAGHGRIVLLSSVNGYAAEPETIDYTVAKTAIIGAVRALAVDLAGTGVTVNAVAPGWIDTPMTERYLADATPDSLRRVNPLGRAGRAEEIADVIAYLVTAAPEFLTGSTVTVDGGQTALAALP